MEMTNKLMSNDKHGGYFSFDLTKSTLYSQMFFQSNDFKFTIDFFIGRNQWEQ